MKCVKCNRDLELNAKFCPKCGSEVLEEEPSASVLKKFFSSKLLLIVAILLIGVSLVNLLNVLTMLTDFNIISDFSVISFFFVSIAITFSMALPSISFIKLYIKSTNNMEIELADVMFLKQIIMITSIIVGSGVLVGSSVFIVVSNDLYTYLEGPYQFGDIFMSIILFLMVFIVIIAVLVTACYIILANLFTHKLVKYFKEGIKPIKFVNVIAILLIVFGSLSSLSSLSSLGSYTYFGINSIFLLLNLFGTSALQIVGGIYLLQFVKLLKS